MENVSFSTKLKFFALLCENDLNKEINLLNILRNQVAHNIIVDKEDFKKFAVNERDDFETLKIA
jgi:hypothetical protein